MNNAVKTINPLAIDVLPEHTGLTKREYFAGLAMQGYISGQLTWTDGLSGGYVHVGDTEAAKEAVAYADALLKALEEKS